MKAPDIKKMSRVEKLDLLECLWADLSYNESELESPAWHGNALREGCERRARNEEPVLDWDEAKRMLHKE